jgi:hypothetical protein
MLVPTVSAAAETAAIAVVVAGTATGAVHFFTVVQ